MEIIFFLLFAGANAFVGNIPSRTRPAVRLCASEVVGSNGGSSSGEPSLIAQDIPIVATEVFDSMEAPYRSYPEHNRWGWQKASSKASLDTVYPPRDPAPAWLLNLVEAAHWATFPAGFYVAFCIFHHADALAIGLDGDATRVFWILLAVLTQLFAAIAPMVTHVFEDWQLAPFRNPLALSSPNEAGDPPTEKDMSSLQVENFNNAWLRTVMYDLLFSFMSVGATFFTLGVFGLHAWTLMLVGVTATVAVVGPKEPMLRMTRIVPGDETMTPRPILPIPVSLAVLVAVSGAAQLLAAYHLFSPAMLGDGSGTLALAMAGARSIFPTVTSIFGGTLEGYLAESTFLQWQHLTAVLILVSGQLLLGDAVNTLAAFNVC